MNMEEAANAVRLYVEAKPFENDGRHRRTWIERLDDCLADIRAELARAAEDDGFWARYLDMTETLTPIARAALTPKEQSNDQD